MVSLRRQLIPPSYVRQLLILAVAAVIVLQALWYLIPNIWAPAWQEGGIVYDNINSLTSTIVFIDYTAVTLLLLGAFLGAAGLWLVDTYRRYPGIILWASILFGAVLFARAGHSPVNTDLRVGMTLFLGGAVVAIQLGGLPLRERLLGDGTRLQGKPPHQMERAVQFTIVGIVTLAVIGIVDHHFQGATALGDIQNTDGLFTHAIALAAIFGPLAVFKRYEDPEYIVQIGPAQSGKTTTQGGLYLSLENRCQHRSDLLEELVDTYMFKGQFPDRTELYNADSVSTSTIEIKNNGSDSNEDEPENESSIIKFTYYTEDILFPKEKIITTVDYPGELLTGMDVQEGEINPLSDYLGNGAERKDWGGAMAYLRKDNGQLEPRKLMRHVAYLVRNANQIIFTVPMDDFIGPIVANRPEMVPEYHEDVIWQIRKKKGGTYPYETQQLGEEDWTPLEADGSQYYPAEDTTLPGFKTDKDGWLGTGGGYYVRSSERRNREPPEKYLREYKHIIDELEKTDHQFMWLPTMADLVYEDFRGALEDARKYDLTWSETASIDVDDENERIEVGRPEIGKSGTRELQNGLLNSAESIDPATKDGEYVLFSRWIREEYLIPYRPRFEDWFDQTFESHVYPVWFEIKHESREQEFENSNPPMKGSRNVTDRFRGEYLKESYPDGNSALLWSRLRRSSTDPFPLSRMAYQILKEVREQE